MSDVSVLSHEYSTASELSQALNSALITLKKVYLDLPGRDAIGPDQIRESRQRLADVLAAVVMLLAPDGHRLDREAANRIPGAIIARLQDEHRGDLRYYVEDLQRLNAVLTDQSQTLTARNIVPLDRLATTVDAETGDVFRRLMRT